eukprot:TRINITY_DN1627_c0_g1_i1.p1 TRINITY_DN1627_c0_g1~~TRINITY_DN1627_c0_g1_i1.p1  ORF type:complete len:165 (-),score=25.31 TRINITY_DN1627_c0_g1_i1:112-606(-)
MGCCASIPDIPPDHRLEESKWSRAPPPRSFALTLSDKMHYVGNWSMHVIKKGPVNYLTKNFQLDRDWTCTFWASGRAGQNLYIDCVSRGYWYVSLQDQELALLIKSTTQDSYETKKDFDAKVNKTTTEVGPSVVILTISGDVLLPRQGDEETSVQFYEYTKAGF